jgi:hypothetical protein
MAWKPSPVIEGLRREVEVLHCHLVRVRTELRTKQQYASRLEMLLRSRTNTIDELTGRLEQARAANQRLEQECEHLVAIIAAPTAPQLIDRRDNV